MANGEAALDTLRAETQEAIPELIKTPGQARCQAHDPMTRALVLILRWQVALIDSEKRHTSRMRLVALSAVIAGILAGLISGSAGPMLKCIKVLFS